MRLEHESQDPEFWNDNRKAKKLQEELSAAKRDLGNWGKLKVFIDDLDTSMELLKEGEDQEIRSEYERTTKTLLQTLD